MQINVDIVLIFIFACSGWHKLQPNGVENEAEICEHKSTRFHLQMFNSIAAGNEKVALRSLMQ